MGEEKGVVFKMASPLQLSVQLQQSSEYWAQKVRELSIDLEKQRQVRQHVD